MHVYVGVLSLPPHLPSAQKSFPTMILIFLSFEMLCSSARLLDQAKGAWKCCSTCGNHHILGLLNKMDLLELNSTPRILTVITIPRSRTKMPAMQLHPPSVHIPWPVLLGVALLWWPTLVWHMDMGTWAPAAWSPAEMKRCTLAPWGLNQSGPYSETRLGQTKPSGSKGLYHLLNSTPFQAQEGAELWLSPCLVPFSKTPM